MMTETTIETKAAFAAGAAFTSPTATIRT